MPSYWSGYDVPSFQIDSYGFEELMFDTDARGCREKILFGEESTEDLITSLRGLEQGYYHQRLVPKGESYVQS